MHAFHEEWILILDFGSQYSQLIARRVRELHVYCEIHPFDTDLKQFADNHPAGIILSGGPKSVYDSEAPELNMEIFHFNKPILGICYGLQSLAHSINPGSVENAEKAGIRPRPSAN